MQPKYKTKIDNNVNTAMKKIKASGYNKNKKRFLQTFKWLTILNISGFKELQQISKNIQIRTVSKCTIKK